MKFTVAICTWNGASRLATTLDSMLRLNRLDDLAWELLIVDNNSTDDTAEVCRTFADRLPLRVVAEPNQGHSVSRNCAIDNSLGEFIVWTDDDVKVDPNWLSAYGAAVDEYPDAVFWGGPIKPFFEQPVPQWVTENWDACGGMFAERDQGQIRFEIKHPEQLPYGANFVTRASVQKQFRFDSKFGRVGSGIRGFDEIDVLSRLLDRGYKGIWIPEASVEHIIPKSRVSLNYVADYFQGQGETWIERGVSQLGPLQIKNRIRHHQIRYRLMRLFFSKRWFSHWVQINNLRGQLKAIVAKQTDGSLGRPDDEV